MNRLPAFTTQQRLSRRGPPWPRRTQRDGQGGATTVEFAIAVPVVILLFVAGLIAALTAHAYSVLLAAAQDGARSTAVVGGTPEAGQRRAEALLRTGLGAAADHATIQIQRGTSTQATVTLPLTAILPVPVGPHLQVTDEQLTEPTIPAEP